MSRLETITSRNNGFLKHVRRIRDGKVAGKFFVEGKRLTEELTHSTVVVESVLVSGGYLQTCDKVFPAVDKDPSLLKVLGPNLFESISQTRSPQGIAAVCLIPETGASVIDRSVGSKNQNIVVLLHRVSNPGNLGSVIRSCEATGVSGVIISRESAHPFSPAAVRGSMGSVFRLPVWFGAEFDEASAWARTNDFTTVCADVRADHTYTEFNWKRNVLIIFGSEAHGLTDRIRDSVDAMIRIPMEAKTESLNLAVAAGVILFEAAKSR